MNCIYCSHELPGKGFFCPNCAKQVTCKNCDKPLEKNANACIYCSVLVGEGNPSIKSNEFSNEPRNTIKYSETKDTKNLDIAFSDNVADSISNLSNVLTNRLIRPTTTIIQEGIIEENITEKKEPLLVLSDSEISIPKKESPQSINVDAQSTIVDNDYPVLKDVVIRDLPKVEWEWILIYCFYASNYGTKSFTSEDLKSLYESSSRKTDTRYKNFSSNVGIVIDKKYIKSKNDVEYIILDSGKHYVVEILENRSTSKHSNKVSKIKATSKKEKKENTIKKNNSPKFIDLGLNKGEITDVKTFVESSQVKGQEDTILVLVKWYKDKKQQKDFSLGEVQYLLKIVGVKEPKALKQVIINMQGTKNFIDKASDDKFKLTTIGESYIEDRINKK